MSVLTIDFSSLLELELDFSEEDVEFANRKKLSETVNQIIDYSDVLKKILANPNVCSKEWIWLQYQTG